MRTKADTLLSYEDEPKTKMVQVRMGDKLHRALLKAVKQSGMDQSRFIRRAVAETIHED